MADVKPTAVRSSGEDGRDRGQLILVTGLAVAVTLVALVLLLNTVIYTQNLATRGAGAEDGAAVAYRQEVLAGVGGVVDAENRAEHANLTALRENVNDSVAQFDDATAGYYAERGVVADVTEEGLALTNGTLLRQTNGSREFASAGNDADWTLVEDVGGAGNAPGARNFRLTVSRENLTDSSSPAGFSVLLDGDAGENWRLYVYDDGGITVAVKNGSDPSATAVCSASGPEATVDLTAGTINGTACSGLDYAAGVDAPYDVVFENGGEATGTYGLTVDEPPDDPDVRSGNFAGPGDDASPRAVPAVYAAEFEVHFETPNLAFHTAVRVARGEHE